MNKLNMPRDRKTIEEEMDRAVFNSRHREITRMFSIILEVLLDVRDLLSKKENEKGR